MRQHRGWIALDIDGTITDASHRVPAEVVHFLQSLYEVGWELIFITGRSYSFAEMALHVFMFPYYLALQNGADILHMPTKRLVARNYLNSSSIQQIESAHQGIPEDFIIYTGYEHGDFCYYRPKKFSHAMLQHLHKIMPLSTEPWKEVDHFQFEPSEHFPLIKCLGMHSEMERLNDRLKKHSSITATLIRDPLDHDRIYLNLITSAEATKGEALKRAMKESGLSGYIIAAGDDLNDLSMLAVADCKIVMENAPLQMHKHADILAPAGHKKGIIPALQEAVKKCLS
jgi:HAD superfamily hydrolase (TIGR01484 family)